MSPTIRGHLYESALALNLGVLTASRYEATSGVTSFIFSSSVVDSISAETLPVLRVDQLSVATALALLPAFEVDALGRALRTQLSSVEEVYVEALRLRIRYGLALGKQVRESKMLQSPKLSIKLPIL